MFGSTILFALLRSSGTSLALYFAPVVWYLGTLFVFFWLSETFAISGTACPRCRASKPRLTTHVVGRPLVLIRHHSKGGSGAYAHVGECAQERGAVLYGDCPRIQFSVVFLEHSLQRLLRVVHLLYCYLFVMPAYINVLHAGSVPFVISCALCWACSLNVLSHSFDFPQCCCWGPFSTDDQHRTRVVNREYTCTFTL